jgi:hypothetical protein
MKGMRRPTDHAEFVLNRVLAVGVLLLIAVAATPFAAGYAARIERTQHAPTSQTAIGLRPVGEQPPTTARREESARGGPVVVSAGVGSGIWVDERGRPAPPPRGGGAALIGAATDAGAILIAGGALLAGLWYLSRRVITRRNLRRWELEWGRVGPEWSRRPD